MRKKECLNKEDCVRFSRCQWCDFVELKKRKIGERFVYKTLDNYEQKTEFMKKAIVSIMENIEKSLFIYGAVGLGKTHLMAGIYDQIKWEKNESVWFYKENELVDEIMARKFDHREQFYKSDYINILMIDDFGKSVMNEWQIAEYFYLIDYLYSRNKQIIISSNYSLSELANKYTTATLRRIDDICKMIEIK